MRMETGRIIISFSTVFTIFEQEQEQEQGVAYPENIMNEEDTNVRVAVRCRPLNSREKNMPEMAKCIDMANGQLVITGPTGEVHSFGFDHMFGENSTQVQVWESLGAPILDKAFQGYNGTIFAYGQTGSGKTWSMQGADGDLKGTIPRMNEALFERIAVQKAATPSLQFLVTVSYFELYNEVIFDLLDNSDRKKRAKSGLEIKEHPVLGVYVKGLQEIVVDSPNKLQQTIDQGMRHRTVASTQMNSESSRSHSIFTVKIHQKDAEDDSRNLFAKVNLVDLAGSERVKSTGATGAILKEGANINKSLSALGNVINALVEQAKGKKGAFVPYRNSKLTRVLQESLGGNSVTVMIAALSPALVNFEETLSTLKYANRAKDIKVKAVKNDESSQISRLNEEIRALREKLVSQTSTVDTSMLEAKHQQQLRDLEEAMKSTWEDKARISEEHERERQRLADEQRAAQKKLLEQREEHWKLLESRGDVDMSIAHLKDLLRTARPDGGAEPVGSWLTESREILRLEAALAEQFTAIDVYRASLARDGECLAVISDKTSQNESKVALGMWKQLGDKFHALKTETKKWLDLQQKLTDHVSIFSSKISAALTSWNSGMEANESSIESSQVARGFELVQRQVDSKQEQYAAAYRRVVDAVVRFDSFSPKMNRNLANSIGVLSGVTDDQVRGSGCDRDGLVNKLQEMSAEFIEYFGDDGILARQMSAETSRTTAANSQKEFIIPIYESIACSNRKKVNRAAVGGGESWVINSEYNEGSTLHELPYLEICLPQEVDVSAVSIQGGLIPSELQSQPMQNDPSLSITLPCGLQLKDCDGSIEHTVAALGCLMDWEELIKKNSPDKFLKRPPVRFLFDLINMVIQKGGLNMFSTEPEWEVISQSKQSKIAFMDTVLSFVSTNLHIPPATAASAIVSGADGHLTNKLLQHLALVAFAKRENISLAAAMPPPPQVIVDRESWVDSILLSTSLDGSDYSTVKEFKTGLSHGDDVKILSLSGEEGGSRRAKFVKLYAGSWQGPVACVRFNVHMLQACRAGADEGALASAVNSETLLSTLDVLRHVSKALHTAVDFLVKVTEGEALRRQEEVRKQLESLADEKLALEEKLVHEKNTLHTEKQGLEEQLRMALLKLEEAEDLVSREKQLREQLETMHRSAVDENASLQQCMREQLDEASTVKAELLRFQASAERDGKLVETLRRRVEEEEVRVAVLVDTAEELKRHKAEWEREREDLLNQIEVLTEERDAARQNEEELFDELRERTNDLERLQESYVDMTDRCNDYQDTISDLREEMDRLQETVLEDHRQFVTAGRADVAASLAVSRSTPTGLYLGAPPDEVANTVEPVPEQHCLPEVTSELITAQEGKDPHKTLANIKTESLEECTPYDDDNCEEDNYEEEFEDDFED